MAVGNVLIMAGGTGGHVFPMVAVAQALRAEGFRVDQKDAHSHMNKRIKEAQKLQVPYMLIAGEREAEDGTVALRRRGTREQDVVPFEQFLELVRGQRASRALEL